MVILMSACLLGVACRYDGRDNLKEEAIELMKQHTVIPICPEQLGGLCTPRNPAERVSNQVLTANGEDYTEAFYKGAKEALRLVELYQADLVILKEKSPSCGSGEIYDGTFSRKLVAGDGVTAELLKKNGILVYGERDIRKVVEGV